MTWRTLGAFAAFWTLIACGGSPTPAEPSAGAPPRAVTQASSSDGGKPDTPAVATSTAKPAHRGRDFPAGATFGDLVVAAAALGEGERASSASCSLRVQPDGRHRLEADLGPVFVKEAPVDLDPLASRLGRVTLTTPFGNIGSQGVVIQALTPLPGSLVNGVVSVLFVTDKAVLFSVATNDRIGDDAAQVVTPKDTSRLRETLGKAPAVIVSAERDVSLDRVRDVLRWADGATGSVVFGVPLGPDDKMPREWQQPRHHVDFFDGPEKCLKGPLSYHVRGRYDEATLNTAAGEIRRDAATCASKLPAGSYGGRLFLSVEIGKDGRAAGACFTGDETQSAEVRACVIERVRALRYPAPRQNVAFTQTIALVPQPPVTRGLCE